MAGWYSPIIGAFFPNDHLAYYQYNVFLDEEEWFWREQGVVYWLEITAVVSNEQTRWGWRSAVNHHLDDAVFGSLLSICIVPDNGQGTIDIIDGLPPGSVINSVPTLDNYFDVTVNPGGVLGGEVVSFDAALNLVMTGSGDFSGYNRNINMPVSVIVHTAPRTPGSPVQSFEADLFRLQ